MLEETQCVHALGPHIQVPANGIALMGAQEALKAFRP